MEDGRLEHRRILEMTKEAEAIGWGGYGTVPTRSESERG